MKMRILIGDDAPFIRELLRNVLQDEDVELLPDACDGNEVLEHTKKYKPDIIFLDLAMPKKNGLEVSEEILQFAPRTKIVIVSSLHEEAMIQKAIAIGCMDFIKKPFEISDILAVIQQTKQLKGVVNG